MSPTNRRTNHGNTSATVHRFPSTGPTTTTAHTSTQRTTTAAPSHPSNNAQQPGTTTSSNIQLPFCPYHTPLLQPTTTTYDSNHNRLHAQTPLARFLAEGPGEQSALYNRPDNGQISLARGCTCGYYYQQQQQYQQHQQLETGGYYYNEQQHQQELEMFFDDVDAALDYGQQGPTDGHAAGGRGA